ncbi:MAG: hypothetical protein IT310_03020 [Anaerolineales bacterium]|nr:hypothetical protein [Anaerolineales bacterium]
MVKMPTPNIDDEKAEELKRSAKLINKNALARVLIMFSPTPVSLGIMFFLRSNIGFFLGWFALGFVFIIRIIIYFYDKNKRTIYYHPSQKGELITAILGAILMWWMAIYFFLIVPYS